MHMQTTLISAVQFQGKGLHSGQHVKMTVRPAGVDYGIRFRRTDLGPGGADIRADVTSVQPSRLCTQIGTVSGGSVRTVEHALAALAACGIANARIDVTGPELPILDGSAKPFVTSFLAAGIIGQDAPVSVIKILKPIVFGTADSWARLEPADQAEMQYRIAFKDAAIGDQSLAISMYGQRVIQHLCDSRTFCRQADVPAMLANGLARGGSVNNAVVVDGARVVTPGGLRHPDEPVRHKMLDAVGDLALAGAPILGRYVGHRAGHATTIGLVRAMFERPDAFCFLCSTPEIARVLPGLCRPSGEFSAVA